MAPRTTSKTIRASEIGSYLYCRRAWWYQKGGWESENQDELRTGTDLHEQHGRAVLLAGFYRLAGVIFFVAALVLLTIYLTDLFI